MRGIYVHPSWYWDEESVAARREAMEEWLDLADDAGFNLLFVWLESRWAAALLGERRYAEANPFWDPAEWDALGELVAAAGERGMEVHPMYSFTRYKREDELVPEYDPDLETLPPGDPDWASVRKSEQEAGHPDPADPENEATALCGNEWDAHEWTVTVLDRLFEAYPGLGGLHVEEPGYLALDRCVCYRCQAVYRQLTGDPGEELLDHVHDDLAGYEDDPAAVPVKTHGTDAFVRRLFVWWRHTHPEKALSFNGHWDPDWDRPRGRNWAAWAAEGMVPYFCPQIYTDDETTFGEGVQTNVEALAGTGATVLPIVGAGWSGGENPPAAVASQLAAALERCDENIAPVGGTNVFSGSNLTPDLARALRDGPYAGDARLPWSGGE